MLAQAEAAATVEIAFGQEFEDFEFANHMFPHDSLAGELAIAVLLSEAQQPPTGFLLWRLALGVPLLQS
jgi:hypothetical protein